MNACTLQSIVCATLDPAPIDRVAAEPSFVKRRGGRVTPNDLILRLCAASCAGPARSIERARRLWEWHRPAGPGDRPEFLGDCERADECIRVVKRHQFRLFVSFRAARLRGEEALPQESQARAAVHLALQSLALVDLPLGLAVAPALANRGLDGRDVTQ
jgi:hypothetical protein